LARWQEAVAALPPCSTNTSEITGVRSCNYASMQDLTPKIPKGRKLRLTADSDFAGNRFSNLDEELQQRFLAYQLGVDIFANADESQIRQVFRRMNSYNVPLNRQEKRHATHQGPLKWFIVDMSDLCALTYADTSTCAAT
jgi:hypothetical protein